MNKLIKFQLRNIFTSKYFYVLASLTLLFSTGILRLSIDDPYYFSRIPWLEKVISILKGDMSFLIMIFICIFNCYDFSNKTLKNIIGRGYTKKEYIISKYITDKIIYKSFFTFIPPLNQVLLKLHVVLIHYLDLLYPFLLIYQ